MLGTPRRTFGTSLLGAGLLSLTTVGLASSAKPTHIAQAPGLGISLHSFDFAKEDSALLHPEEYFGVSLLLSPGVGVDPGSLDIKAALFQSVAPVFQISDYNPNASVPPAPPSGLPAGGERRPVTASLQPFDLGPSDWPGGGIAP